MDRKVTNVRHPTLNSVAIQLRVIGALLMREVITRYGRHNLGFLWVFLEPMLFTLGVTLTWRAFNVTHGSSLPITAFAITGYSSILLWRNCSNRVVKSIEPNLSLFYHRNVRVLDVFVSRLALEIAGATTSFVVLIGVFAAIGWLDLPSDILTVAVGWFLLCFFSVSLSLVVGAASERFEIVERVWHIFTYLMFPISGAAFMVDWFSAEVRSLILWVPMVHATEMIRHGFFGDAVRTYEDPAYLLLVNVLLLLMGLALVREAGRRVQPE